MPSRSHKHIRDIDRLTKTVLQHYERHIGSGAFTIGISGIDGSGKGYVSCLLQERLEATGYKVATINLDPWQQPLHVRLKPENAAENFYQHVFRWEDVFHELLNPLQANRSVHLSTQLIRTDADEYFPFMYDYPEIDILIIEAIFLFQPRYLSFFDLKIWIDCPFDIALQRAIARNVEKLDEKALIADYETYYFPAQRYHISKDDPLFTTDYIFDNSVSVIKR